MEAAGLAIGAVALVPLIKNVRQIYDSIKDAPNTYSKYQLRIWSLLTTLELVHSAFIKYDDCPEKLHLASTFEGTLTDINTACIKLDMLLKKKLKTDEGKIGIVRKITWSLFSDDTAKEAMDTIEKQALRLHMQYQVLVSLTITRMYNTHLSQVDYSANAIVTPGENILSLLAEVPVLKTKFEEMYMAIFDSGKVAIPRSSRVTEQSGLGPIKTTSGYYLEYRQKDSGRLTAKLSKVQLIGRQSGRISRSRYEIKITLYSELLGRTLNINLGLDMSSWSLRPIVGLHFQRVIPKDHIQHWYVRNHMFEEFRELVVQGKASIHDIYYCDSGCFGFTAKKRWNDPISLIEALCCSLDFAKGAGATYMDFSEDYQRSSRVKEFLCFLLQEGYHTTSRDMDSLIKRFELPSIRLLVSNGFCDWESTHSLSLTTKLVAVWSAPPKSLQRQYDCMRSSNWEFLLRLLLDYMNKEFIRRLFYPFIQPSGIAIRAVLEHVVLEFLQRVLPKLELEVQSWTFSKRYNIVLAAVFCETFDIVAFLLHRRYPFKGIVRKVDPKTLLITPNSGNTAIPKPVNTTVLRTGNAVDVEPQISIASFAPRSSADTATLTL
ncbi:hypothetical protein TWF730_003511 [Orbilia blumenaviensis]|uniref:Uncharacterized protein n=1 Tax=Orbilia blumenaviensis TaxID=1796055 RepID=A0AAV9U2P8_9PEZI